MFVPPAYAASDPRSIVRAFPFATFVTTNGGRPFATLTPIFFASEAAAEMELIGHLAARNAQAEAFRPGQQALAIFTGPHAYVSASWYRERPTVPTWNYVSAQVRGRLEPVDDPTEQLEILAFTAGRLEGASKGPWTLDQAPAGRIAELLPRIRAFRIRIETIEGATKLSQAQPPGDRLRVIDALEARGDFGDAELARLMRENMADTHWPD